MAQEDLSIRYQNAVDSFIEKIRSDQNVIAVIVCGSLSYDTVWEKSDIDTTVIVRDQNLETKSYCIDEDDIIINVSLVQRSSFKRNLEKTSGGSMGHSYYAKGKIAYTTDESLYEYFEDFKKIGKSDVEMSVFFMTGELIGYLHKAQKWLEIKNDLTYSRYYILKAVEIIAKIEVCIHFEPPTREAIQRAAQLNPKLIEKFYETPMRGALSREETEKLIQDMDDYLLSKADLYFAPVREYMEDGEIKTVTMITRYFHAYDASHFIIGIFEYLAEKGYIEKITQTIRITPKSRLAVEEAAFIYIKQ